MLLLNKGHTQALGRHQTWHPRQSPVSALVFAIHGQRPAADVVSRGLGLGVACTLHVLHVLHVHCSYDAALEMRGDALQRLEMFRETLRSAREEAKGSAVPEARTSRKDSASQKSKRRKAAS